MTRPLQPETETQAEDGDGDVSEDARRLGYEPLDAPARAVALGMAGLALLMVLGLILCGALLRALLADQPPAGAAPFQAPPPPRLDRTLIPRDPPAATLAPPPVRDAMGRLTERGWGEAAPAPPPEAAARAHAEAAR